MNLRINSQQGQSKQPEIQKKETQETFAQSANLYSPGSLTRGLPGENAARRPAVTPANILKMQRTLGNKAVLRLLEAQRQAVAVPKPASIIERTPLNPNKDPEGLKLKA